MSMQSKIPTRLVHVSPPLPNEIFVSSVPIRVVVPPDSEARMPQFQGGFSPLHPAGCAITRADKTMAVKYWIDWILVRINKRLN